MRGFFFAGTKRTNFIHFSLTFASPLDEAMNTPTHARETPQVLRKSGGV